MADVFHTFFGLCGLALLGYTQHDAGGFEVSFAGMARGAAEAVLAALVIGCERACCASLPLPLPTCLLCSAGCPRVLPGRLFFMYG